MGTGDLRPWAPQIEFEIAPPVASGRLGSAELAEHPGQVEVSLSVVGLHLEGQPVPGDSGVEVPEVLLERAQVECRLATAVVGAEGFLVALAGALVVAHPVLEEAQVVP